MLGAALLVGAFLRLDRLSEVPPGYSFDEAAHGLDALDILGGQPLLLSRRPELAHRMSREPDPEAVFLYGRLSTNPRPHFTLDFLHRGQAPLRYVPGHAIGGRRVHVIALLQAGKEESRPTGAGAIVRHLRSAGQPGGVERTPSYTIVTVRLSRALTERAS